VRKLHRGRAHHATGLLDPASDAVTVAVHQPAAVGELPATVPAVVGAPPFAQLRRLRSIR
jgi:hypothetical protein